MTQVCGVLDGELVALEAQLEARNKVREERALLQRFLGMAASIDKIEKLLATASDEAGSAQHGKLVERVASEYNQLQFYVTHSRDHPFVVRMQAVSSRLGLAKICSVPFRFLSFDVSHTRPHLLFLSIRSGSTASPTGSRLASMQAFRLRWTTTTLPSFAAACEPTA